MFDMSDFVQISPNVYADALGHAGFMDYGIQGLWAGMPRVAGPAFTVQLARGDNLMFHAAIYEAPPGSIIVADAVDRECLCSGPKEGIAAFVIDGVIRDIAEIWELGFPVFAQGVVAGPGKKEFVRELSRKIYCGGTAVPKIPHSAFAAIEMTTEKLWLNWNVINAHINSNMKNIGQ